MTPLEQVNLELAPLYALLVWLAYIVFVDSRKRWTWARWWTRLVYVLSFGTPPRPATDSVVEVVNAD